MTQLEFFSQPTAPTKVLTTCLTSSRARTDRHLLEEVCYGKHLVEQLGQEGGALYPELRGEIFGRKRSRAEASERHERAVRDGRIMRRKGVGVGVGRDSLPNPCVFLRVKD